MDFKFPMNTTSSLFTFQYCPSHNNPIFIWHRRNMSMDPVIESMRAANIGVNLNEAWNESLQPPCFGRDQVPKNRILHSVTECLHSSSMQPTPTRPCRIVDVSGEFSNENWRGFPIGSYSLSTPGTAKLENKISLIVILLFVPPKCFVIFRTF